MAKIVELETIGYDKFERDGNIQTFGNAIVFLTDDAQIQKLFAANSDGIVTIQVVGYDDYPNSKVNWLNLSRSWLNLLKFLFFFDTSNYFVISKVLYDQMKAETQDTSNTVAVRLGKDTTGIAIYIAFGYYGDYDGGGTDGLLHGARIPPA